MKTTKQNSQTRKRNNSNLKKLPFFGKVDNNDVQVHLHTSPQAALLAQSLNAQALTHGNHIFFNKGKYSPGTTEGKRLLAHEMTHVKQQKNNPSLANTIQRYAVPGTKCCTDVPAWLDANSPHKPAWALTKCRFTFSGSPTITFANKPDGTVTGTVKGKKSMAVGVNACPIDAPTWTVSKRTNQKEVQAAWDSMKTVLMGHEREHQKIGADQQKLMDASFKAMDFSVDGATKKDAQKNAQAGIDAEKKQLLNDHQAAQNDIDPFNDAILECPEGC